MVSIVGLLLALFICSYSTRLDVHWMGGRCHVDMVSRWYVPANAPYMPGRVVDRARDNNLVESLLAFLSITNLMTLEMCGSNLNLTLG